MLYRLVMIAAGSAVLLTQPLALAHAQDCYSKPVKARGSPGLLESTAKSRARSNWIKKVGRSHKLGKSYAAWLRAKGPSYACHKVGKRIACTASATPCKVPSDALAPVKPILDPLAQRKPTAPAVPKER